MIFVSVASLSGVPVNARMAAINLRSASAVSFGSRASSALFHCVCALGDHDFAEIVGYVKERRASAASPVLSRCSSDSTVAAAVQRTP